MLGVCLYNRLSVWCASRRKETYPSKTDVQEFKTKTKQIINKIVGIINENIEKKIDR